VFGILDYNIDLFEVNGIGRPTLAWTWNDLVKTAERLTADTNGDGKLERFGISKYLWDAWRQVSSYVRATGASVYSSDDTKLSLNTAGATRALRFLEDEIIKKGLLGGNFIKETVGMQTGEGIMHVLGSDSQAVAPFRRGMAVMPKDPVTGGRSFTGLAAPMIGISKTTAHPEAAWKFVKYLTEAWFAGYWKEKGYSAQLPTRRSVAQRYFMKPEAGKIDPNMDLSVALELINYSCFEIASTNPWMNLNKPQIEAALTTEWRKVLQGATPYSAMVTNAETLVNALLQGK
jgi:multiple sugar transport system substrate-binding protein